MAECNDKNCPVHGRVKPRGAVMEGRVVSDRRKKTVTVRRDFTKYIPKYERYARAKSKVAAHNPDCIGAKVGDLVRVEECRKLSKTKAWVVTKILRRSE